MKILEVSGLQKNYKDLEAVKGIDFSVNKGEFVALLGPNGAGKSTTLNVLCTLLKPTAGDISYNGYEIGIDDEEIRKKIGIVFQDNVMDDKLSVRENLLTRGILYHNDRKIVKEKVDSIIATLKIDSYESQYYGELSGGQRRRVDIARALLHSPEILFLDEPTTGLDPSTRKLIWETMDALLKEGLTIILTTHYMEETMNCDKVIIMNNGQIICSDTPEQLRVDYSNDVLKVIGNLGEIEKLISDYQYELHQDYLKITLNETTDSIELLQRIKKHVEAFEVLRGNMDDVFLNLTGTRLD